jgi:hypothetical protein
LILKKIPEGNAIISIRNISFTFFRKKMTKVPVPMWHYIWGEPLGGENGDQAN